MNVLSAWLGITPAGWTGIGTIAAIAAAAVGGVWAVVKHRDSKPRVSVQEVKLRRGEQQVERFFHFLDPWGRPSYTSAIQPVVSVRVLVYNTGGEAVTISRVVLELPITGNPSHEVLFEIGHKVGGRDHYPMTLKVSGLAYGLLVNPLSATDYVLASWRRIRVIVYSADGKVTKKTSEVTVRHLIGWAGRVFAQAEPVIRR